LSAEKAEQKDAASIRAKNPVSKQNLRIFGRRMTCSTTVNQNEMAHE